MNFNSASILTRLVSITLGIFIFASSYTSVHAACTPSTGSCGSSYSCNITKNGKSNKFCCGNAAECTAEKANSGSSLNNAVVMSNSGVLKVDPEIGCSGGVNTALGCIPYETKGFTSSLLGFLAGTVGLLALIVMLVATVMIMTGGANPEQVKKGKELFTGGISGLFFIVFSVTLLRIIAGDIIKLPGF